MPPQNSTEFSVVASSGLLAPTSSTRTGSGYFSPKTARTPGSFLGLGQRHRHRRHRQVGVDLLVDQSLDLRGLFGGQRFVVGEVEACLVGVHQRAFLLDVVARTAQGPVEQVRRSVVAHGVRAVDADLQRRRLARLDTALGDMADVQHGVTEFLRVRHLEKPGRRDDGARITDLAALLAVEVGVVQQQGGLFLSLQSPRRLDGVVAHPADDGAGRGQAAVLGRVVRLRQLTLNGGHDELLPALARLFLELVPQVGVPLAVNAQPRLGCHLLSDVDEEAIGSVQVKGFLAADDLATRRTRPLGHFLKQLQPAVQSANESFLLFEDGVHHLLRIAAQLGEGAAHDLDNRRHQFVQERRRCTQVLPAISLGAAQDAADDVAAFLIRRPGPIGQGEGQCPNVVGDYPIGGILDVTECAGVLRCSRHLLNGGEEGREDVGVVVARLVLDDRGDALEAHAGIDVPRRQRAEFAIAAAVVLDEDEVPYLDNVRRARVDQLATALVGGAITMNLAARSARSRFAHLPEVVFLVAPVNVARVDVGLGLPQLERLVVARYSLPRVPSKTVACRRLLSSCHTPVSNSQAQRMASFLK